MSISYLYCGRFVNNYLSFILEIKTTENVAIIKVRRANGNSGTGGSWPSSFSGNQQWQWSSTSGLASDQSASITVKPNSLITANYTAISQPTRPIGGLGQAAAPLPDCGGLNFGAPYPFPSGKCHHDNGDRYFLFKFLDKSYYALVMEVYAGSHDYYILQRSDNKIILDNSPDANYDLYVYDYDQNPIGNSQLGNGTEDIVTIPPPSPITTPTISKVKYEWIEPTSQENFTGPINLG